MLDDTKPYERTLGIEAGLEWGGVAHGVAVYMDRGMSGGMRLGIARHLSLGLKVEERWLDSDPCSNCAGEGEDDGGSCNRCDGSGRVPKAVA